MDVRRALPRSGRGGGSARIDAWLDIENPPQVQYLAPFERALSAQGCRVGVTVRDYSITVGLLRERGIGFEIVGRHRPSNGKLGKAATVLERTWALRRYARSRGRPHFLVCSGRSAGLSAKSLRIPVLTFCDYEHVDLQVARVVGSHIFLPDVIDPEALVSRGVRADHLIPYRGLKEDISFSAVDVDAIPAHEFPGLEADGRARVLLRPPGEETHYFAEESRELAFGVLAALARRDDVVVVYSPRYSRQTGYLDRFTWINTPVVLDAPVPFVALLRAVDAVISAGGTMLREAAYLGIPAYSIFRSQSGAVDRYLESIGRLTFVSAASELEQVRFPRAEINRLRPANPALVDEIAATMVERARSSSARAHDA